jgi:putative membrane protein
MSEPSNEPAWQRLSPLSLALAIVNRVPGTLQWTPAVAAIGLSYSWWYAIPALILLHIGNLVVFWIIWLRFRWRLAGTSIVIESGILERKHRTIPFDRIQDVSIEQGLLARILDVAKVGFETGAASGQDGDGFKLDAISMQQASSLRDTIRAWRDHAAPSPAEGTAQQTQVADAVLFTLTPRNLMLAGLFNFSLAAIGVAGAMASWLDDFVAFDITDSDHWTSLLDETGIVTWVDTHRFLAGAGVIMALLLVGVATGLIRTTLTNWEFRLSMGPRAFRRTRGLATRTDVAITLSRIQAAIVTTDVIRSQWGWHALWVQSLAQDSAEGSSYQLIPFGKLRDIDLVLSNVAIARPPENLSWHSPPMLAQALPSVLIAFTAGVIGLTASVLGHWEGVAALAMSAVIMAVTPFATRRHRWAEDGTTVYIWRGWLRPRLTILPFANVQSADLRQGPVLRHLSCVRLTLGVPGAGGLASHVIDALPLVDAHDLRSRILSSRSTTRRQRPARSPSVAAPGYGGNPETPASEACPVGA